jgi:hypothetical protein
LDPFSYFPARIPDWNSFFLGGYIEEKPGMKRHVELFESWGQGEGFRNGDRVRLTADYAGDDSEVFTLSQWDDEYQRGWIGDEDGRGWYVRGYQIERVEDMDEDRY